MSVYVGIGHGVEPNGSFDPGAVGSDGTLEHDLNKVVVAAVGAALDRSGVDHFVEVDSGASHDPDFQGSTKAVNAGGYGLAIEVHFDEGVAPPGGFGIYLNDQSPGKRLADAIRVHWAERGLPQRNNQADVRGLFFLKATSCPAVIWECDPTTAHDETVLAQMGEAIGAGICDFVGTPVVMSAAAAKADKVIPKYNPPLQLHDVVS